MPQDVVRHRTGPADHQKDGHVHQEAEEASERNDGHVCGIEVVVPDGVEVVDAVVVQQRDKRQDEQGGQRRHIRLQLQRVAVERSLERARPNLVEGGDNHTGDGVQGAHKVEAKVGDGGDDDAQANRQQRQPEVAVEILLIQQRLDDDDGGGGHDLHDLVKADAVVLQAEVGEADEAHSSGSQFGHVANRQALNFEHAALGGEQQQQKGAQQVKGGEGDGEQKAVLVVHELVDDDDGDRGEEVEQHGGGRAHVNGGQHGTQAIVRGGLLKMGALLQRGQQRRRVGTGAGLRGLGCSLFLSSSLSRSLSSSSRSRPCCRALEAERDGRGAGGGGARAARQARTRQLIRNQAAMAAAAGWAYDSSDGQCDRLCATAPRPRHVRARHARERAAARRHASSARGTPAVVVVARAGVAPPRALRAGGAAAVRAAAQARRAATASAAAAAAAARRAAQAGRGGGGGARGRRRAAGARQRGRAGDGGAAPPAAGAAGAGALGKQLDDAVGARADGLADAPAVRVGARVLAAVSGAGQRRPHLRDVGDGQPPPVARRRAARRRRPPGAPRNVRRRRAEVDAPAFGRGDCAAAPVTLV
ncbi:glucose-6-phosphate/phosphate translocator [Gracilaria domingensis]|nr:glucose-6-phosphate/phosphate translocator [Gracilaria domingensis]